MQLSLDRAELRAHLAEASTHQARRERHEHDDQHLEGENDAVRVAAERQVQGKVEHSG